MYLLLMWGYLTLQTPQYFAVFAALVMCTALLFWVSEAAVGQNSLDACDSDEATENNAAQNQLTLQNEIIQNEYSQTESIQCEPVQPGSECEPTLSMSVSRLDALKDELTQQYAQFGKDQSLLNSKGLGTWQQKRAHKGRDAE